MEIENDMFLMALGATHGGPRSAGGNSSSRPAVDRGPQRRVGGPRSAGREAPEVRSATPSNGGPRSAVDRSPASAGQCHNGEYTHVPAMPCAYATPD